MRSGDLHVGPGDARVLAGLVALAALVRIAAVLTVGDVAVLHGDENDYLAAARALAAGTGYPGSARAPGFPLFAAAVIALAGDSLRAIRLAQVALSCATVAMVFDLVRGRRGVRAAAFSGLVVALHPTLVSYAHFLWTETAVAALLVALPWSLERWARARDAGRAAPGWLVACGLAGGALALTREMFAPLVLAAAAWVALAGRDGAAAGLRRALLVAVPAAMLVLPWTIRNTRLHGRVVLVSTTRWMPIALGNLPSGDGSLLRPGQEEGFLAAYRLDPDEIGREERARGVALRSIAQAQPGWIARKVVRTAWLLWMPASQLRRYVQRSWLPGRWSAAGPPLVALEEVFYVVATALGILGLWLVRGDRTSPIVVAAILLALATYTVANANHRFRVPLLPLLAIPVGPLIVARGDLDRRRWRVVGAALCLAAFTAVVGGYAARPDLRPAPRSSD